MSSEAVVQLQLDAYNARDLHRFLSAYSDEVRVFRPPAPAASIVGKPALAEYYATQRFNLVGLNAELVNRMVLGNKVIDHERISGVRELPFEVVAVYEVADDLIWCSLVLCRRMRVPSSHCAIAMCPNLALRTSPKTQVISARASRPMPRIDPLE